MVNKGFQGGSCCGSGAVGAGWNPSMQSVGQGPSTRMTSGPYGTNSFVVGQDLSGQGAVPRMPGGEDLRQNVFPQMATVGQIVQLVGALDPNQLRTLHQFLGERMNSEGRGVPEFFGELPRDPSNVGGFGNVGHSLPGIVEEKKESRDIFSRSEKWLSPAPLPEVDKWTSRELEVAGFSEYLLQLASWAAQASLEFSEEITQSARWHGVMYWSMLTAEQRNRSTRLLAILRSAFATHPRTMMLLSAFVEGVHLHKLGAGVGHDDMKGQSANGYELLRQLTLEYSLRTRAEALSLRSLFVNKSYTLSPAETSASSLVSDVVRRIDLEAAKFSRLISILPAGVDVTGLSLPDADLLVVLLKSLPQEVRSFCLHHASGESYAAYREAARRWEQQQRLFVELPVGGQMQHQQKKISNAVFVDEAGTEWFTLESDEMSPPEGHVDTVQSSSAGGKCQKCGSRKHRTFECTTDVSKLKCCQLSWCRTRVDVLPPKE